jgi:hypothetical protein
MPTSPKSAPPHSFDARWYVVVDGKTCGPYSCHEIRRMVEQRQILESDLLWPDGGSEWVEAKNEPTFDVLFQRREQSAAETSGATGTSRRPMIKILSWLWQHRKEKRVIYPGIIAVLIAGYVVVTIIGFIGSFFGSGSGSSCREEAARSAKSKDALSVLLSVDPGLAIPIEPSPDRPQSPTPRSLGMDAAAPVGSRRYARGRNGAERL